MPQVRRRFRTLEKRTKRRPYIRSAYFQKEKVFFDYFWQHLQRKALPDRARRLRFFPCAIELVRKSRLEPQTYLSAGTPIMIQHVFFGETTEHQHFAVVVSHDKRRGTKQLLTCYPLK